MNRKRNNHAHKRNGILWSLKNIYSNIVDIDINTHYIHTKTASEIPPKFPMYICMHAYTYNYTKMCNNGNLFIPVTFPTLGKTKPKRSQFFNDKRS